MNARTISLGLLFLKTFAGLGVGIVGMIILLIFVLLGLGTVSDASISGPFLTFAVIVMGFVTALITNSLGVFAFGMIDRAKYPAVRDIVKRVIVLNIFVFIFLLPVYFFAVLGAGSNISTIFLIATLQLVISAQASMLVLDISAATKPSESLLAIYSIVFAILATIIVNLLLYELFQNFSTPAELAVDGSGGKGATAVLFAILPTTWFFFGFFTTAVEMIYSWIYETWGVDFLSR